MQILKLKVLVEAGAVRAVAASYQTDPAGWTVQVTYASRPASGARSWSASAAGCGCSPLWTRWRAAWPGWACRRSGWTPPAWPARGTSRREPGPAAGPAGLAGAGGGLGGGTGPRLHPGLPSGGGRPAQRHGVLPAARHLRAGCWNTPRSTSGPPPARPAPSPTAATPPPGPA